jgi:hypothetical protein
MTVTLLICSLVLWGAGALFYTTSSQGHYSPEWTQGWLFAVDSLLLRFVALVLYALTAILLSCYLMFERRASWQPFIMLYLVAANFSIQADVMAALTQLLMVVALGLSLRIDHAVDERRVIFSQFAFVATSSVLFPQFLLLLPLLLIYPAQCGKLSPKTFFAALLGVAMPMWIGAALLYLFPALHPMLDTLKLWLNDLLQTPSVVVTPSMLLRLCAEPLVTLPAIVHFLFTATVGRTHLRRRVSFFIAIYVVLWLAGWLRPELFTLYFVWRLPIISLLAAYIFPALPMKTSNIYFIATMLLWAASAVVELWIA